MCEEFKFRSGWEAYALKNLGLGCVVFSILVLEASLTHSRRDLSFSASQIPFHLFLWGLGALIFFSVCEVEVTESEFRFRRFRTWRSFPLKSVVEVRHFIGPAFYVKVRFDGTSARLLFNPFEPSWKLRQPYPPPIIVFLRDVCQKAVG